MDPHEYAARSTHEHGHQVALFMWAAQHVQKDYRLALMFAIPNGGERNKIVAARLKAEGVKPGVPDVMLPTVADPKAGDYNGLFIELKLPGRRNHKKGGCSDEQLEWHRKLHEEDYYVAVCYGFEDARLCVCWWLGLDPKEVP